MPVSFRNRNVTQIDSNYVQQYDAYIDRQKRKRQRLKRRLILFSIAVAIILGSLTTYHLNQRALLDKKEEQYEQLQNQLASLEKGEKDLKEEIKLLNDDEYVLDIARTNYFFSKEGELIFKVPDEDLSY